MPLSSGWRGWLGGRLAHDLGGSRDDLGIVATGIRAAAPSSF